MINAPTALINFYEVQSPIATLIGARVAAKHKFGTGNADAWPKPSKALVLSPSGGNPDLYTARQGQRFEARCYGERVREAMKVYDAVIDVTRDFQRTVVETQGGRALIYFIVADSGPDALFDIELELDYIQVFLRAAVAEEAVP